MESSIETIEDDRKPPLAPLGDQSQVTAVPAQRWGAVGLMAAELRHGLDAAVLIPQQHCGSPPQLTDHCQEATITTESWILLTAVEPGVPSPFDPATATQQAGGQQ